MRGKYYRDPSAARVRRPWRWILAQGMELFIWCALVLAPFVVVAVLVAAFK